MKKPLFPLQSLALLSMILVLASSSRAGTFMWNVASPGANNWNVNNNWTPNTGNPGTADTALFGNTGTAANATTVNNVVSVNTTITALSYTNSVSGQWNVTQIPASTTLTTTGTVTVGGGVADSATTSAAMVGPGTFAASGTPFNVGNSGSAGIQTATFDISGLSNFVYSATSGTFQVGNANRSQANMNFAAASNSVSANTMNFNTLSSSSSGSGTVRLGGGTNIFNVNTWNMSAGRLNCTFNFIASTGGLRIRGTNGPNDDTARVASMVVGNRSTGGSGGTDTGTLSFNGHPVDVKIGNLTLGQCNSSSGVGNTIVAGIGNLLFDNGVVDATNITLGNVTGGSTNAATGNITVGTNATLIFGRMVMATNGSALNDTASSASLTNFGTVVFNGNAFKASAANATANFISGGGSINLQTNQIGNGAIPIDTFSLSNTAVHLRLDGNSIITNVYTANLLLTGSSTIVVDTLTNGPSVQGVPKTFPICKYTTETGSAGANFNLPILPSGYIGIMVDFPSSNLVAMQVYTNVPTGRTPVWTGANSGDWDFTTPNWSTNSVATTFQLLDSVLFNDSLAANPGVNLTTVMVPNSTTVSNTTTPTYTFSGPGRISGTGGLTKKGTGTLVIDNAAINDFTGGVTINTGTVQIGNNDTSGNLPTSGGIANSGALVYDRSDNVTIPISITGPGSLTQLGGGVLTLNNGGAYSGKTEVDSGALILNGNLSGGGTLTNAPGTTLIVSGTNTGPVSVNGVLLPGSTNTAATMGAGGLSFFPGATVTFDLNSATTPGAGVNDLIEVAGGLTLNGNALTINLLGAPTTGVPYRLVDYTGPKSGSFNSTVAVNSHLTATLDQSTANQINVSFSGSGAILKWDSGNGTWDVGVSQTWSNAVSAVNPDFFYQGDAVFFDDEPGVATTISIPSGVSVSPSAMTNNSTVNIFTLSGPGKIIGSSGLTKIGNSTLTMTATNAFTGAVAIGGGAVRATAPSALGSGLITVNNNATLVVGAAHSNSITMGNGVIGVVNADFTMNTNAVMTVAANTTNVMESTDPQTPGFSRNLEVDARLSGGGAIVVFNGPTNNSDGGQGVRFRNTNAISDFTGTITYTNNTKGELLVQGPGPFSPINTGSLITYAGTYNGDNTTFSPDTANGYMELNLRNNSAGNSIVGNNVLVAGTGAVVINALGSAPNNAVTVMGNLTVSNAQEIIGYKAASSATNAVEFTSVTLTGGNTTFSPKSSTFGATTGAGTFLILSNVSQTTPGSGIIMNGLSTLTLAGTSTFTGPTAIQQGKLFLNGFSTGNSALTGAAASVLAGNGTNTGSADISGMIVPGDLGTVGTVGTGPLTLESGATLAYDLSGTNTANGGVNDLIQVNGNLTVNGNVISNNVTQGTMQTGSYRLMNYSGTLTANSPMSSVLTLNGILTRYAAAVDTSTLHQVNLNVTGGPVPIVWDSTASTVWDANTTANWSNTVSHVSSDVFFQGDSVLLNDVSGVQTNLTITGIGVAPAAFTNNSATNYAITGTGKITGATGLMKDGSGMLTLGTSNDFTGNVVVRGGTLRLNTTNGLGLWVPGNATITNGGTLDIGGLAAAGGTGNPMFGAKQFLIGGPGVGSAGTLVNNSANQQLAAFQNITLVGDASFGGSGRWDMRNGTPGPLLDLAGFTLTKTSTNQISLVSVSVTSGNININQGVLSFESGSTVTNSGTLTVNPNGSLGFFRLSGGGMTIPVVLNGGAITNLAGGGSTNDSPVSVTADSTLNCLTGNDLYLRGPISGSFGLFKINSGTTILSGTNSYTGNTIVSNGALIMTNLTVPLTNSANVAVGSGALLSLAGSSLALPSGHNVEDDGTITNCSLITVGTGSTIAGAGALSGSVTVNSGGTISGNLNVQNNISVTAGSGILSPGTNTVLGKITAGVTVQLHGSTVMKLDKSNVASNDVVACVIGTTIFDGPITVTNVGPALTAGDTFTLFSSAGGYSGTSSSLVLPVLAAGLGWNSNQVYTAGVLSVVSTGPTGPTTNATITKVTLSGTNVLVHGTNNNVPNTSFHYAVLTTANITNALTNWIPVVTNSFNPDGTFDYTNPIVPGTPRQFIDIEAVP